MDKLEFRPAKTAPLWLAAFSGDALAAAYSGDAPASQLLAYSLLVRGVARPVLRR